MKAMRFCVVKGHETYVASRICTFQNCDYQTRWLCSECVIDKLHKHDQKNKDHIMKQQDVNDLIFQLRKSKMTQFNMIQQSICRLKYIVSSLTKLISQLDEQFKNLHFQINQMKSFQLQINEDFLSIDIKKIENFQNDSGIPNSQNIKELDADIINLWRFAIKMNFRCVLIGPQGSGKTKIFNKICGIETFPKPTIEITQSESKSKISYTVIDTPGMHRDFNDNMKILGALTEKPVNRILLIVNCGIGLNWKIKKFTTLLSDYLHLITIIINSKDQNINEQMEEVIRKNIMENFKITSIIFFDSQPFRKIDSSIDSELQLEKANSFPQKLNFSSKQIYLLMDQIQLDPQIKLAQNEFFSQFNILQQSINHYLNNQIPRKKDKIQALQNLQISFINQVQSLKSSVFNRCNHQLEQMIINGQNSEQAFYFYFTLLYGIEEQVINILKEMKLACGQDENFQPSDGFEKNDCHQRYISSFEKYISNIFQVSLQNKRIL